MNSSAIVFSLIIPVYHNEKTLPELLDAIQSIFHSLPEKSEVVFVVDASPDQSYELLKSHLPQKNFASQLLLLSKNCGSYSAIKAGLEVARGRYFAVMAADLQEPPELIAQSFLSLSRDEADVVFGVRAQRQDQLKQQLPAQLFWHLYRKFIQKEMPQGGVDIFACNIAFKDALLNLKESNSTLIGLAVWLGFRRKEIPYERQARKHGKSAWSLKKRLNYAFDSAFAFSDLPIRLLYGFGIFGIVFSILTALIIVVGKITGNIIVPGYASTLITIIFFAALNLFGLGIIGSYIWRIFENTKQRPAYIIQSRERF